MSESDISGGRTATRQGSQPPVARGVELVRERWFFNHLAPDDRSNTLEYVVRNNTTESLNQLFLPLPRFLYGLKVIDEDERRLNYLPNHEVESWLSELKTENPEIYDSFMARFPHAKYRILIVFPHDRLLLPGELRTIRLLHVDGEKPEYVKWSHLTLPVYHVRHQRLAQHSHGLFVVVQAPSDTHLKVDIQAADEVTSRKHYHANEAEEVHYHFSSHLPPADGSPYEWGVTYKLGPTRMTQVTLLVWLIALAAIASWLGLSALFSQIPAFMPAVMSAIAGGAAATSAGLLFALKRSWADWYRFLLLPFLLVDAVAWLAWSIRI